MICPSMRWPTVHCPCFWSVLRDVRHTRAMCFTCIPVCWSVPAGFAMSWAADRSRRCRSSRHRRGMYPHIFRPTSFPSQTVRFSWRATLFFCRHAAGGQRGSFRIPCGRSRPDKGNEEGVREASVSIWPSTGRWRYSPSSAPIWMMLTKEQLAYGKRLDGAAQAASWTAAEPCMSR